MTKLMPALALIAVASGAAIPAYAQATATPPVPTTKILAISHPGAKQASQDQFNAILEHEVRDTVGAYLNGKIDQWYFQTGGRGVIFIVNAKTVDEAKSVLEKFPLGQAGLMAFDYIPIGPLRPLSLLANTPIPAQN